jgi:hypothetical protein
VKGGHSGHGKGEGSCENELRTGAADHPPRPRRLSAADAESEQAGQRGKATLKAAARPPDDVILA